MFAKQESDFESKRKECFSRLRELEKQKKQEQLVLQTTIKTLKKTHFSSPSQNQTFAKIVLHLEEQIQIMRETKDAYANSFEQLKATLSKERDQNLSRLMTEQQTQIENLKKSNSQLLSISENQVSEIRFKSEQLKQYLKENGEKSTLIFELRKEILE